MHNPLLSLTIALLAQTASSAALPATRVGGTRPETSAIRATTSSRVAAAETSSRSTPLSAASSHVGAASSSSSSRLAGSSTSGTSSGARPSASVEPESSGSGSTKPGSSGSSANTGAGDTKLAELFKKALCDSVHPDITPLNKPVLNFGKAPTTGPQHYLKAYKDVKDTKVQQWQKEFFASKGSFSSGTSLGTSSGTSSGTHGQDGSSSSGAETETGSTGSNTGSTSHGGSTSQTKPGSVGTKPGGTVHKRALLSGSGNGRSSASAGRSSSAATATGTATGTASHAAGVAMSTTGSRPQILSSGGLDPTSTSRPGAQSTQSSSSSDDDKPPAKKPKHDPLEPNNSGGTPAGSTSGHPLSGGSTTIITLFYTNTGPRAGAGKSLQAYLEKLKRLADTGEQIIAYVSKDISSQVKAMRKDTGWHVVDDYPDVWSIPSNTYQKTNFENKQGAIFDSFKPDVQSKPEDEYPHNLWDYGTSGTDDYFGPNKGYNSAFLSAVYNAKAFVTYDAVLRNPFGSTMWMYMDSGLLLDLTKGDATPTEHGKPWDMITPGNGFIDEAKMKRTISLTGDSGVAFPEYEQKAGRPATDVTSKAFTDPRYQWQTKFFLGGIYVGNSLGMLNFAVRFMQTVDILDANGRYSGREEFVTPIMAAMYPHTVFSQPIQALPPQLTPKPGVRPTDKTMTSWFFMLFSYVKGYGDDMKPVMVDPVATKFCPKGSTYKPRGML